MCKLFPAYEFELDLSCSELVRLHKICRVMGTVIYLVCIAVASFIILAHPAVAQGANATLPLTYPAQVLQGDGSQTCPSEARRAIARNEVKNDTQRLLRESVVPLLQVNSTEHPCGGSGWRRVAYLNMSDSSQQCPSVWQEIATPFRVCGRRLNRASCEGLTYTTGSEQYGQVCGRIVGYQRGTPDAFRGSSLSIDSYYLDGISVTHGSPRQHIWSFAGGFDEENSIHATCPCVTGSTNGNNLPSFVGQNYFCEAGITRYSSGYAFWPNGDPLWDGQGCGPTSSCCTFNSPPWFNVQLSSPTTDDIEVRICGDQPIGDEDTPVQRIELYVK